MTDREEHEQLADALDRDVERLQQDSRRLKGQISDVREDWERKRGDDGVPGAVPRLDDPELETTGPEAPPERETDDDA